MTKKEQQDSLFSLNIIHGYIKHYALQEDYDRDHCIMHLKSVVEILERDKIGKEEDKPQLAYGIYNNIGDKDTLKNV